MYYISRHLYLLTLFSNQLLDLGLEHILEIVQFKNLLFSQVSFEINEKASGQEALRRRAFEQ